MTDWHEMTVSERDALMRQFTLEGERAALADDNIKNCPYRSSDQRAIWWRRGFGNAKLGAQLAASHRC
jgi:ribosome modulation factor